MKLQELTGGKNSSWIKEELSPAERASNKKKADIAAAIIKKRREKGMNQKEFAHFLGYSQGMVSRLESGECNLTIEKIDELFEKLKMHAILDIMDTYKDMSFPVRPWKVISNSAMSYGGMLG